MQINKDAPLAAQAQTLFAAMNPQLAVYDPLATRRPPGRGRRRVSLPLRRLCSSVARWVSRRAARRCCSICGPSRSRIRNSALRLRSRQGIRRQSLRPQGPAPPHTRVAYIWASRIPNASLTCDPDRRRQISFRLSRRRRFPSVNEPAWKYLDRARKWALVDAQKKKKTRVDVV